MPRDVKLIKVENRTVVTRGSWFGHRECWFRVSFRQKNKFSRFIT
jgi:hypothetical protein